MPRHFLDLMGISAAEARWLIDHSIAIKRDEKEGRRPQLLAGRTLGLLFEKPSLRTRVSFEAAIARLGGDAIFLHGKDVGLGVRESLVDFRPRLESVCRRPGRPHFFTRNSRRAGAVGDDTSHQRTFRHFAPLPGDGRFHDDRRAARFGREARSWFSSVMAITWRGRWRRLRRYSVCTFRAGRTAGL